jgi:hypothetical protein
MKEKDLLNPNIALHMENEKTLIHDFDLNLICDFLEGWNGRGLVALNLLLGL